MPKVKQLAWGRKPMFLTATLYAHSYYVMLIISTNQILSAPHRLKKQNKTLKPNNYQIVLFVH